MVVRDGGADAGMGDVGFRGLALESLLPPTSGDGWRSVWIPGRARGKGRPRGSVVTGGAGARGRVRMYTERKDVVAENWARTCWVAEHGELGVLEGALEVVVEVVMALPAAAAAVRDGAGPVKGRGRGRWFDWLCGVALGVSRPVGKPDADNLAKLYLDGLNGVAWLDDSQVATLVAVKRYAGDRDSETGEGVRVYARAVPGWMARPD